MSAAAESARLRPLTPAQAGAVRACYDALCADIDAQTALETSHVVPGVDWSDESEACEARALQWRQRQTALERVSATRAAFKLAWGLCESALRPPAPGARWYVTALHADRWAVIAGPFATHRDALLRVDDARRLAVERFPAAAFAAFGTAAMARKRFPRGVLNAALGLPARGTA
jgi:hypothetical protein